MIKSPPRVPERVWLQREYGFTAVEAWILTHPKPLANPNRIRLGSPKGPQ